MNYPNFDALHKQYHFLIEYSKLKAEEGSGNELTTLLADLENHFATTIEQVKNLPEDRVLSAAEPNLLPEILSLRPEGPRDMRDRLPSQDVLTEKMAGALYARIIACLLGVPVEGWTLERMEQYAGLIGQEFPPLDYWTAVEQGYVENVYKRYRHEYTRDAMVGFAPVDDDINYTQAALLLLEQYGHDFTTADVGKFWSQYIPYACTAEEVALINLKKGLTIDEIGVVDNPYQQWIGAAIRSDGFAYAAPGNPQKAAEMAYNDAYLSHRRNGIYGEMFLAAAQSAAFVTDDPMEALRIGLSEIPTNCSLANDLRWALEESKNLVDFRMARNRVDQRFQNMSAVHTNNNLCLVVFGLALGKGDFLKTITETVAMGLDNDCTAASVGSIIGAIVGKKAIPSYLYERFNNRVDTYLTGVEIFQIDDMVRRFVALANAYED